MRAHEFLEEGKKEWLGLAAYAAVNAGAAGLNYAGYGGDPDFLKDKTHQVQQQDQEQQAGSSVTIPLDEPRQYHNGPDHSHDEPEQEQDEEAVEDQRLKEQATLLALTMWGEARSHGDKGMRAVGHVILNRVESERNFGDNVKEVVWKRKHFSCWNPSDPNRAAMKKIAALPKNSLDYKRWLQAKKIAAQLMQGKLRDITNGALFYHTDYIKTPSWAKGQKAVAQIANHVFYQKDRIA